MRFSKKMCFMVTNSCWKGDTKNLWDEDSEIFGNQNIYCKKNWEEKGKSYVSETINAIVT